MIMSNRQFWLICLKMDLVWIITYPNWGFVYYFLVSLLGGPGQSSKKGKTLWYVKYNIIWYAMSYIQWFIRDEIIWIHATAAEVDRGPSGLSNTMAVRGWRWGAWWHGSLQRNMAAFLPERWRVAQSSRARGLPRTGPECGCAWRQGDQGDAPVLGSK